MTNPKPKAQLSQKPGLNTHEINTIWSDLKPYPVAIASQGEKRHADAKKKHEEEVQRMKKDGGTQKNIGRDMTIKYGI